MDDKTALQVKGRSIVSVMPDAPVLEAVGLPHDENIGAVIVMEEAGSALLGMFSERDVIRVSSQRGRDVLERAVADIMTRDVVACTSDSSMDAIISGMTQHNVRHLPVFEDDKLLGLISARDVMQYRIQQLERGGEDRFQRWFPKGKVFPLSNYQ